MEKLLGLKVQYLIMMRKVGLASVSWKDDKNRGSVISCPLGKVGEVPTWL